MSQSPSLKKLLQNLAGRKITIPTTKTFMDTMAKQFADMKVELINVLSKQKYVCCTADVWSARAQSYLGMTVHFITDEFIRQSYVLAFRRIKGRQTYDVLSKEMADVLAEFKLPSEKVTHIVTDGGSAFCKSFRVYGRSNNSIIIEDPEDQVNDDDVDNDMPFIQEDGEYLSSNILYLGNDQQTDSSFSSDIEANNDDDSDTALDDSVEHEIDEMEPSESAQPSENAPIVLPPQFRCVSHRLNLVEPAFMKQLNTSVKSKLVTAISKLHGLWVLIKKSSAAKTICIDTIGSTLLIPCVTRWNSKFDAINKSFQPEVKPKINILIQKLKLELKSAQKLELLSTNDWNKIDEYLKVLRPVANSLDKLQGEKNAGMGYVLPTLVAMKHRISMLDGRSSLLEMKRAMLEVIRKRFDPMMKIATENRELLVAAISQPRFKTAFIENEDDVRIARSIFISECARLSDNVIENESTNQRPIDNDDFFVSFSSRIERRSSIENQVEAEVLRYLNDERSNYEMLNDYPTVKNAFFRFNTTLSSSGPIERVYSQSGMIFTPRRNRISAQNFERTLLLKHNRQLLT